MKHNVPDPCSAKKWVRAVLAVPSLLVFRLSAEADEFLHVFLTVRKSNEEIRIRDKLTTTLHSA